VERLGGIACLVVLALACLGACAFCYCSTLFAIAVKVGPPLLYLLSLVFTIFVPILYGRALFRVFGRDGFKALLLAPAVALLTLVYLDYAYLLSLAYMDVVHSDIGSDALLADVIEGTHDVLQVMVVFGLGNDILHIVAGWFDPSLAGGPLVVAISAGAKLSLVPPCVLLARGVSTDATGPEQPAHVEYFRFQAFPDLGTVLRTSVVDVFRWLTRSSKINVMIAWGPQALLIWPLCLTAFVAMVAPVAVGATMLASIAVFHALSLAVIWLVAMWFSRALYLAERAVIFSRSRYAKCPYHDCHEPVPLPVFACPECGARHDRLVPGRFGFLWRSCECGRAELPTLFVLGKGNQPAFCPHCDGPMPSSLFGSNVHVPVYGGPSSGKTMLVMAESYQMLEGRWPGISATLITEQARRSYASKWKPQFESGQVREKTRDKSPDAFLLSIRGAHGLPVSLYLYDPAGEAMHAQSDLRQHTFLRYLDGLMILVDPLSLPSFAEEYQRRSGPDLSHTTSALEPASFVDRLLTQLEEFARGSRTGGLPDRVAVVFTKADIPHFQAEVGVELHDRPPVVPWTATSAPQSRDLESWLQSHEPELHNVLTTWFRTRRFFAVSATGHLPSERREFEPRQVLEPLAWLLSGQRALTQPALFRGVRSVGEAVLATTVFSAVTWVPALFLSVGTAVGLWLL